MPTMCLTVQLAFLLLLSNRSFCQNSRDLDVILQARKRAYQETSPRVTVRSSRGQDVVPTDAVIEFYQRFVSPQDVPVCNFVPSCSQFARDAINRYGVVTGGLMASERLQRCHPLGDKQHYSIDVSTGRYVDRVP